MWKFCNPLLAALFALLLGACQDAGPQISGTAPSAVTDFAIEFASLHGNRVPPIESTFKFFHWEAVLPKTREAIVRSLAYDLETPVKHMHIEPWDPQNALQFFGSQYTSNLEPRWVIHLHYDSDPLHMLSLPVGQTASGEIRIANPIPIQSNPALDHVSR